MWGRIMLDTARFTKETEGFYNLFQDGFVKKADPSDATFDQFINLCRKSFGKEGIETFNTVLKEFYENVGVVPRAQYHALEEKYETLKEKIRDLEQKIESLKKRLQRETDLPSDLMNQWTDIARVYADINQQFFNEFSKFFKS
jgi:polyhydroxyalkanoate synthesis regulator phasin